MRQAATVLIFNDQGKILAVSRKNNPNDFGLPGGKVDADETPAQAAVRELREETGLALYSPTPIFRREDADGFITTTFTGLTVGDIRSTEEGVVAWIDQETLFAGSFGDYNRKLLSTINKMDVPTL